MNINLYPVFAPLFRYPEEELRFQAENCLSLIRVDFPQAAEKLQVFSSFLEGSSLDEMEEIFTKTFHIQAICFLDLGYVIFGEDYKRGEFLAEMKREQREAGNDCGYDLPDNLPNILTLLPLLREKDVLNELVLMILIPGLKKMLQEFDSAKMQLRSDALKKKHNALLMEGVVNGNIYQNALGALLGMLEQDFKDQIQKMPAYTPPINNPFLNTCGGPPGYGNQHIGPKTQKI